mmetsp:Transcript_10682/g.24084  ORF Transcript_10682/g.24084 Transcript_10682/m.24084 type:complete len:267 (-) Transcript_10682:115-915(-)
MIFHAKRLCLFRERIVDRREDATDVHRTCGDRLIVMVGILDILDLVKPFRAPVFVLHLHMLLVCYAKVHNAIRLCRSCVKNFDAISKSSQVRLNTAQTFVMIWIGLEAKGTHTASRRRSICALKSRQHGGVSQLSDVVDSITPILRLGVQMRFIQLSNLHGDVRAHIQVRRRAIVLVNDPLDCRLVGRDAVFHRVNQRFCGLIFFDVRNNSRRRLLRFSLSAGDEKERDDDPYHDEYDHAPQPLGSAPPAAVVVVAAGPVGGGCRW